MKIFSDLDLPFDLDHTLFFFFVVHAIAKTVHTISSTKFQIHVHIDEQCNWLLDYFTLALPTIFTSVFIIL